MKGELYITQTELQTVLGGGSVTVGGVAITLANIGDYSLHVSYTAPTIPTALSDLTDDATHRTVTDTEKSTWNGKADAADVMTAQTVVCYDQNGVAHTYEVNMQEVNI